MNCQDLARLLDERDLDRLRVAERIRAETHLAVCPECARDLDLHRRLNALPIPPLSAERIAGWRAVALCDSGRPGPRRGIRSRLVVISTLIAVAAAAALLAVHLHDASEDAVAGIPAAQPQGPVDLSPGSGGVADSTPIPDPVTGPVPGQKAPRELPVAQLPAGSFTVLVLPLQIEGENSLARSLGEEFYSKLLGQLRLIPGLILLRQDSSRTAADQPADFRLKISSGYGRVPERFGGHEQWIQNLVAEAYGQGTGSYSQVLSLSNNPDCGRISPADLANAWACTPAGMVEIDIQQLRRNVFAPDPGSTRQLQARFLDTALPQGVRRQALADLIELRQRAPGAMDPELIQVIIHDAIANAPYPTQRVMLWRALRGQSAAAMVQPLIASLRREADDMVRLEMVAILASEFSADPAARAELDLVAKRDTKLLVRKVAERALAGAATWRAYVVSTVKDANLSAVQRFEPLAWMAEAEALRPSDPTTEMELMAVARQLFDDGEAIALADVLTRASSGSTRMAAGVLQIRMSSLQHPAVADFLIATVDRQPEFSTFSLLGRHRADPRIEAKLQDIAANHVDASVRQLAAAQLLNR